MTANTYTMVAKSNATFKHIMTHHQYSPLSVHAKGNIVEKMFTAVNVVAFNLHTLYSKLLTISNLNDKRM